VDRLPDCEGRRIGLEEPVRSEPFGIETAKGLLRDAPEETYRRVFDQWLFPLYSVDLSPIKVRKGDLRAIQLSWWWDQMGV
jgi:hypothetical protein